jgi:glycosyltransferase involved in cell wall biosynthesis
VHVTGDLRVLVLTPEYVPRAWGGLATYLHEVVSRLVVRGARVDVLLAPTYAPLVDSVDQSGLPRALIVDAAADPDVHAAAIEREWDGDYDVAFVQDPQAAPLAALLLSRSVCQRVVATAHLPTYSGFSYFDKPEADARHQALEALLFRLSHRVVAPSRFAADVVLRVHRLNPEDLAVLTYGAPTLEPIKRVRLASDPLDVISVGRVAKQKGLDDLCDISDAVPEHVASFTHIGSARRDADDDALRRTRILRLGYRPYPEVLARLLEADVVLSTSMYETFGLALLEGMAAGAVPVAFECGAYAEFIEPDISGVLVAPGDVTGAAQAIECLHRDAARLHCLADGAVVAARRFVWDEHVTGLEAVLAGA